MHKKWKTFWITCGVLCCLGVLFCVAGWFLGSILPDNHYEQSDEEYLEEVDAEEDGKYFYGIRNLKINVTNVEVSVVETSEEAIRVDVPGEQEEPAEIRVAQEADTLMIQATREVDRFSEQQEVYLYIPEGTVFQEVEMTAGAGMIEAEALQAAEMNVEVGAGIVTVSELSIEQELSMTCGAGMIDVMLAESSSDYNYDVECGMGTIEIGNDTFHGVAMQKNINHNAEKEMELECGMGTIQVAFE